MIQSLPSLSMQLRKFRVSIALTPIGRNHAVIARDIATTTATLLHDRRRASTALTRSRIVRRKTLLVQDRCVFILESPFPSPFTVWTSPFHHSTRELFSFARLFQGMFGTFELEVILAGAFASQIYFAISEDACRGDQN